jgi:hypothetical protein
VFRRAPAFDQAYRRRVRPRELKVLSRRRDLGNAELLEKIPTQIEWEGGERTGKRKGSSLYAPKCITRLLSNYNSSEPGMTQEIQVETSRFLAGAQRGNPRKQAK